MSSSVRFGRPAFLDETRQLPIGEARLIELDAHINDVAFADAALAVFDEWIARGRIPKGVPGSIAALKSETHDG